MLFSTAAAASASTYIAVEDEGVYQILSRLEAEGVITSGLLDTKPISRKEAGRLLLEAEADSAPRSEFVKSLIKSLRERLGPDPSVGTQVRPVESAYVKYIHTNAEVHPLQYGSALENEQPLNHNNNGDIYRRGSNERIGLTSRLDDWGPLSLSFNPEFRYPKASYTGYPDSSYSTYEFEVKKAYAVFDLGWDFVVGKDSQWWGPGNHGALLLSNNAEPFTMLKLTNPVPGHLPWIFDSLGPFRFTFFVTRLENERPVPQPYLYGMRFDLKPSRYIDIALEKTALIGGKGQPNDLKTVFESVTFQTHGRQDYHSTTYVNIDDERAGFDFKVTIPWRIQPMQIYLEADGEDESSGFPLPQSWAFLGGLYLPRILGNERFDLRLEYATTRGRVHNPYVWYRNGTYTSYTYKGNIIGDFIGTDSSDLFTEVSYLMPERNGRVFLSYNQVEHNLNIAASHETLNEVSTGAMLSLTERVDLSVRYSFGRLNDRGNAPGPTMNLSELYIETGYRF
jgi:hypothetical protein